jgi:hypothetical protein
MRRERQRTREAGLRREESVSALAGVTRSGRAVPCAGGSPLQAARVGSCRYCRRGHRRVRVPCWPIDHRVAGRCQPSSDWCAPGDAAATSVRAGFGRRRCRRVRRATRRVVECPWVLGAKGSHVTWAHYRCAFASCSSWATRSLIGARRIDRLVRRSPGRAVDRVLDLRLFVAVTGRRQSTLVGR